MATFSQTLEDKLPQHLRQLLTWDFIPWDFVKDRHSDTDAASLTALLDAYRRIDDRLDLEKIASYVIPKDSWGCLRCGFCCVKMRPGPVKEPVYTRWEEDDAPVAWFYRARMRTKKNRVYRCWYNNGVRLKLCPFLIINGNDMRPFCSIYHMGEGFRPPVCSRYTPRHETCTSIRPEQEPWEIT